MKPWIGSLGAVVVIAALSAAGAARGAVTVVGDGQAKACEQAAVRGESAVAFEDLCTRALETEPLSVHDRAGTLVNRGVFKLRRAEWAAARRDFDLAIRMAPRLGEAFVNRGAAAIGEHRFADGLADVDQALALGLEQPEKAWFNRALAHEALGDVKAAYLDYRRAQELAPAWPAPQAELARFTVSHR